MADFSKLITDWYKLNYRQLPWRTTQNSYEIWLSEVILQQTRVAQGLPYFERFFKKYPTVKHLAMAKEDEVLKLWQGLGYYSRARNMLFTAQEVIKNCNGVFPSRYNELILLKGIGEYTASAIASFSSNEQVAVVDGNVYRVLSRFFGIESAIDSTEGKKIFREKAYEVLNKKKSGEHNQAIMEMGALICTPKNPDCENCVLKRGCVALQTGKVIELPYKAKKTKVSNRFMKYLVIHDGKNMLLRKRENQDIWKGLYEFPLIENENQQIQHLSKTELKKFRINVPERSNVDYKHLLSHRKLFISFTEFEMKKLPSLEGYDLIPMKAKSLPGVPQVILRYLQEQKMLK